MFLISLFSLSPLEFLHLFLLIFFVLLSRGAGFIELGGSLLFSVLSYICYCFICSWLTQNGSIEVAVLASHVINCGNFFSI